MQQPSIEPPHQKGAPVRIRRRRFELKVLLTTFAVLAILGPGIALAQGAGAASRSRSHQGSPAAGTDATYDFNSLTGSNTSPDYTSVVGQDGWQTEAFAIGVPIGVTSSLGFDGTPDLIYDNSGPSYGADAWRLSGGSFQMPMFWLNVAVLQGDFGLGYWGNQLAVSHDANPSQNPRNVTNAIGPQLNIDPVPGVQLIPAEGSGKPTAGVPLSTINTTGPPGAEVWIRLRLVINLTANNGQGSGSVSYENLWHPGPFQPVAGLQNVNLGLNRSVTDARNPALWNSVWLHMEGRTNELDNIRVANFASP
jgi:hypothetical protein